MRAAHARREEKVERVVDAARDGPFETAGRALDGAIERLARARPRALGALGANTMNALWAAYRKVVEMLAIVAMLTFLAWAVRLLAPEDLALCVYDDRGLCTRVAGFGWVERTEPQER